jgi:CubicO group peptidase (beta-lactamase class C family)
MRASLVRQGPWALLLATLIGGTPGCLGTSDDGTLGDPMDVSDPPDEHASDPAEDLADVPDTSLTPEQTASETAQEVSSPRVVSRSNSLFANVLDRREVAWASVRDLTSAEFNADFEARKAAGMMVLDIDVVEVDGQQRVSAVWQQNTDGRAWRLWRNLTSAEFGEKWNEYRGQGYLLIDQESYVLSGKRYYAGVWIENREGLKWASFRNATSSQFATKFTEYRDAGYLPIDVEVYPYGDGVRYAAIWVENNDGRSWIALRDMSASAYASSFESYKQSYRVMDIESYRRDGAQNYAAVWIQNDSGRGWHAYRDMSSKGYGDQWKRLRDAGYRVIDFEEYPTANGHSYAAVWRQTSDRPSWAHRGAVDTLLEKAMADFDIPGMSVAIAVNGEFQYMRGLGYANLSDKRIAHSRTIYRLASGSKAVAGALGLDLEERGLIDLDRDTRSYAPSLPTFHTHAVWHTLANRSGIGHYSANGSPASTANFTTATAALEFFKDNALAFTPGTGYLYSTHAYTAAGAAFEGALGAPIADIVHAELTDRYGLGSLRVENRSVANGERSSLYTWNSTFSSNRVATPDNLSWKVLGGGLESSVVDYVRFGIKLVDGTILEADSLARLWTRPDTFSGYALGWSTGTDSCQRVVAKDGGQLGSNSYIRIYPDAGIVIAVLTNRQNGGHSAVTLGRGIGGIVLTDVCP